MKRFVASLLLVLFLAACAPSEEYYGERLGEEYGGFDGSTIPVTYKVTLNVGGIRTDIEEMTVEAQRVTEIIEHRENHDRIRSFSEDECAWRIQDDDFAAIEAMIDDVKAKADTVNGYYERLGTPVRIQVGGAWAHQTDQDFQRSCEEVIRWGGVEHVNIELAEVYTFAENVTVRLSYLDGYYYLTHHSDGGGEFTIQLPARRFVQIAESVYVHKEYSLTALTTLPKTNASTTDYSLIMQQPGQEEIAAFSFPQMDLKGRTFFLGQLSKALPLITGDLPPMMPVWSARLQSGLEEHGVFDANVHGEISGFIAFYGELEGEAHEEYAVELQELLRGSVYLVPVPATAP